MSTEQRREQEKTELRAKILAAAREMFAKEGFEAVSMRKLARRINYSATAIYLYFKDKQALFQEICLNDLAAMDQTLEKLERDVPDPVQRIQAASRAFIQFALTHAAQYQIVFMTPKPQDASGTENPLALPYEKAYEHMRETFVELSEAGRLKPEFDDADLTAQVFFTGIHGILAVAIIAQGDHCQPRDWRSPADQAEFYVKVLLAGILR